MSELETICVHLGAHKTATTHLQKSLNAQRDVLLRKHIRYYGPGRLRGPGKSVMARFGPEATQPGEVALDRLVRGAKRLVISEENLMGWPHPPRLARDAALYPRGPDQVAMISAAAAGTELRLFLGIRNFSDFYTSLYSQMLFSGRVRPFDRFLRRIDYAGANWAQLVTRLTQVAPVVVWRHEDYPGISPKILRRLLGWKLGKAIPMIEARVHQGLSQEAVAQLVAARQASADLAPEAALDMRRRFPQGPDRPAFDPWTRREHAESRDRYGRDLDRIASLPDVTLLTP